MRKNDLINAFSQITADETKKQQIRRNLLTTKEKKPKIIRKPLVALIAFACVFACSIPVVAESVKSALKEKFPEAETMQENIQYSFYDDNDGHIQMTVEEFLSDEMTVLMTVHYKALDEKGKEWLLNRNFENDAKASVSIGYGSGAGFGIAPDMQDNTIIHGVNVSFNTEELTDFRTDTDRYFVLYYEASSRDYDSGEGIFAYPMTNSHKTVYLDTKGNVSVETFELLSDKVPSEYFKPTHIEISDLSFVIYAMQNGVYETFSEPRNYGQRWILPDEEYNNIRIYLVTESGKTERLNGWMNATHPDEKNNYSDLVLLSGRLPDGIKAEDVVGIEINGVIYELK